MKQEVALVNPMSQTTKAALGIVSCINEDIPKGWFKVDMREALHPNTALIVENLVVDQEKLVDVVGANVIWNSKDIKSIL